MSRFYGDARNASRAVVERIKDSYRLRYDAEVARRMGVSPVRFAQWMHRDNIPYRLIVASFPELDLNYAFRGQPADGAASPSGETLDHSTQMSSGVTVALEHLPVHIQAAYWQWVLERLEEKRPGFKHPDGPRTCNQPAT
ncbi:MAG: hypothetical protein HY962_06975 [Ignavibacteriae bacterium]|nr:hypothetical protein [Ignavibacteriota bacterium]